MDRRRTPEPRTSEEDTGPSLFKTPDTVMAQELSQHHPAVVERTVPPVLPSGKIRRPLHTMIRTHQSEGTEEAPKRQRRSTARRPRCN